jgi:hypothetical protein
MSRPAHKESLEFPGWSTLLEESRKDIQTVSVAGESSNDRQTHILNRFVWFPIWRDQLWSYENEFCKEKALHEDGDQKGKKKKLILETRAALRYGLVFLGVVIESSAGAAKVRRAAQDEAVGKCQWHLPLGAILSQRRAGDSKCRAMAAKILCNLVTANFQSSLEVANAWPLSPSSDEVRSRIIGSLPASGMTNIPPQNRPEHDKNAHDGDTNWVDMVLFSQLNGNREAMAAVVAALHNCICSLQQPYNGASTENEHLDSPTLLPFIQEIGSNSILISTLVRHFVSVEDISNMERKENDNQAERGPDTVTQWIHLLLAKLSQMGTLPEMYKASGGGGETSNTIVPEQVVLLHCWATVTTEALDKSESKSVNGHPIGGAVAWKGICRSHEFLANLFSEMHTSLIPKSRAVLLETGEKDEADLQLMASAGVKILEMLGASLSLECLTSDQLRRHLGTNTLLLRKVALVLASLVDTLSERSFGHKPRELRLSNDEQQLITSTVRLLGNLCFGCRHNQDLMRLTPVPSPPSSLNDTQRHEGSAGQDEKLQQQRTALHVLLSCTTFGHACFTLREWSVVAIRNVLDKNDPNQEEVARLEAQQPMDTAELKEAGVRVNLDGRPSASYRDRRAGTMKFLFSEA